MKKIFFSKEKQPTKTEWVSFLISLAILALIVGLVLHSWTNDSDRPPILQATASTEIREFEGQYYVPFTVTNLGGETAESVQIIGELHVNGRVEQSGEQQIDFLSADEKQEGAFVFTRNPREGDLIVRVGSYKLP